MAKRQAKRDEQRDSLRELVELYDRRLERANNWDLIDLSVRDIMGAYWQCLGVGPRERRRFLKALADSGNLWRERAAMVSTWATQRMGSLDETFWLAEYFLGHHHDLMHKAVGWMLREAGKSTGTPCAASSPGSTSASPAPRSVTLSSTWMRPSARNG